MEEIHKRIRESLDFVLLMAMLVMLGLAGIAAVYPMVFRKWISAGDIFNVCVQSTGAGSRLK